MRSLPATSLLAVLTTALATAPPELTATTFDELVGADAHTLVEFHAPWCTACSAFAPVLHAAAAELARERPDVQFARVDGDAQPELRTRFAIDEAPSLSSRSTAAIRLWNAAQYSAVAATWLRWLTCAPW